MPDPNITQQQIADFQNHITRQMQHAQMRTLARQYQSPFHIPPGTIRRHQIHIGMSMLHRRLLEKRQNLRAADGALVGYRYWRLAPYDHDENRDYFLMSPSQNTIWHGPVLEAHEFSESSMCEGYAGVHAKYRRDGVTSRWPITNDTEVTSYIWGRVRGYGAYVRGTEGWRAQRVMVDKLWLPTILNLTNGVTIIPNLMKSWGVDLADRLATRYECRVVTPLEKKIIDFDPSLTGYELQ